MRVIVGQALLDSAGPGDPTATVATAQLSVETESEGPELELATAAVRAALAAPFIMVWILPIVYWSSDPERLGRVHEALQALSFLCMGWLSFLLVLTVARDVLCWRPFVRVRQCPHGAWVLPCTSGRS